MSISEAKLLRQGTIADYAGLAKPGGILPHLVTASAAMFMAATARPDMVTVASTLIGGGLVAASANTFNSYLDRDIDALMSRTASRPLASGQISPNRALIYGISLGLVGALILTVFTNWMAAILAVAALAYYILPYTQWSKRRTYWSAIVGSGAGAITPLVGWAAITHHFGATPFLLSSIIMLWTVPHFWALATFRKQDYARAGIRVLPPSGVTTWIVASSFSLVTISIVLAIVAHLGMMYVTTAALLDAALLILAVAQLGSRPRAALWLYRYSIAYVGLLFVAMMIDRLIVLG